VSFVREAADLGFPDIMMKQWQRGARKNRSCSRSRGPGITDSCSPSTARSEMY